MYCQISTHNASNFPYQHIVYLNVWLMIASLKFPQMVSTDHWTTAFFIFQVLLFYCGYKSHGFVTPMTTSENWCYSLLLLKRLHLESHAVWMQLLSLVTIVFSWCHDKCHYACTTPTSIFIGHPKSVLLKSVNFYSEYQRLIVTRALYGI